MRQRVPPYSVQRGVLGRLATLGEAEELCQDTDELLSKVNTAYVLRHKRYSLPLLSCTRRGMGGTQRDRNPWRVLKQEGGSGLNVHIFLPQSLLCGGLLCPLPSVIPEPTPTAKCGSGFSTLIEIRQTCLPVSWLWLSVGVGSGQTASLSLHVPPITLGITAFTTYSG